MSRLEIHLLGSFGVLLDDKPVTGFESVKVRAMLAYLAAESRSPQRREHLAGLLWPDWPQKSAMSNLRYALADLRQNIGDREAQPPYLIISRETIQLNSESDCRVDISAFERPNSAHGGQTLGEALYRGEFLEGISLADSPAFEDWVRAKREFYRRLILAALDNQAEQQVKRGDHEAALVAARRAIEIEPWHEPAHQHILRILAQQGKRVEAVAHYESLRKVLKDELDIEPSESTRLLYEQVRLGTVQETSSPSPVPARTNNFPAQLTSFIGRQEEIAALQDLLADHRMVTLTGSGGTGKSRLALRLAAEALENYPDGAWLVELAPLADPAFVPKAVLAALGLLEYPGKSPIDILVDFLHTRRLLLVLDNCEHLLETCASLSDKLLRDCPELTILATSREILSINGEAPFRVPPMALPDAHHQQSVETLCDLDAVHLFVERAQLVLPDFELNEGNATSVVQVVTRLDGIPLAIELAASRLRLLGIDQVAQRLHDAFRLLTGGSRTALPRHQTLRASIDWSYNLLSEKERILLRRLSVFAGSWRLQAAEAICADETGSSQTILSEDILDLLSELVDKSLVSAEKETASRMRYRMLETIRQYAHEKLVDEKEAEALRNRHLAHYLELAETLEPKLRGREQVATLDQVSRELDNIRLALEWGLQTDVEAELRLASALKWFWHIRFHWSEVIDWLEKGLTLEKNTRPTSSDGGGFSHKPRALIRARALAALGVHRWMYPHRSLEARNLFKESLALYRQAGIQDDDHLGYALNYLAHYCENNEEALSYVNEAMALFQRLDDHHGKSVCYWSFANIGSDMDQRKKFYQEFLAHNQLIGDEDGIATAWMCLGYHAWRTHNHDQARLYYIQSADHYQIVGNPDGMARSLFLAAISSLALGNLQWAAHKFDEAIDIFQKTGNTYRYAWCIAEKCALHLAQGEYTQAQRLIEESHVLCQKSNDLDQLARNSNIHSQIMRYQGEVHQAKQVAQELLENGQETNNWLYIADALVELGELAILEDDIQKAQALLQQSLAIRYEHQSDIETHIYFTSLAKLAVRRNDMPQAARLLGVVEHWCHGLDKVQAPVERLQREADQAAARLALGDTRYEQLYEEGRSLTLEQSLTAALEVCKPDQSA